MCLDIYSLYKIKIIIIDFLKKNYKKKYDNKINSILIY